MIIDTSKLTTFEFDLSCYLTAYKIKDDMRKMGVQSYVYAFYYYEKTMKFGVQYDSNTKTFGERIYRQAFHIPGWPTVPSKKTAGNDMLDIIKYFPGINKNDVKIQIWDMTDYPRENINDYKFEINQVERQFIKEHISKYGFKPIGNIKDESHMDKKTRVQDITFDRFFG
jgi:hypothetical protein